MEIVIKKVENGYVLTLCDTGQEYIFQKWSQVVRHLRQWESQEKS